MNNRIVKTETTSYLPVIGKIKIGEKAISTKTGKEYPVSLDHFKATGKYESYFYDAFGKDKIDKIPILFISDDAFSCSELMVLRTSKGDIYGKSDGEEFSIWNPTKKMYETFFKKDVPDIVERTEAKTGTKWHSVLTLRFIIPKIRGVLGVWQLETKGVASSIKTIRDTFDMVLTQAGSVRRVMFDLTVSKHKSQQPDNPSSYPVINLTANVSDNNLILLKEFMQSGNLQNVPYITDESLLKLTQDQKQIPEKIEVLSGDAIQVNTSEEHLNELFK